jgi:hypothetical protein
MTRLSFAQLDALERAIISRRRVAITRQGREIVILPRALRTAGRTELLDAVHPSTGDSLTIDLEDVDSVEVVG